MDHLAALPVERVAGWYRRLADRIGRERVGGEEPLASVFLRQYLDNREPGSIFRFPAPAHLRDSEHVQRTLAFHRAVFLTEEKARLTGGTERWAGVVPRLQGRGYERWDCAGYLKMHYESLVEIGGTRLDILRLQAMGTPEERDLFTALRGFQLRSDVRLTGEGRAPNSYAIRISSWDVRAKDTYDFNFDEHLTVPNPDYQRSGPDAVRPEDADLRVYHRNAQRLEEAGLAAPFRVESEPWPAGRDLRAGAYVDPTRAL